MRFLKLLFFIMICVLAGCNKPDTYDTHNNPIKLSDYQGKWLIVNYWAPWCQPCLTEMPELNSFYLKNKDKVVVFGISYDKLPDQDINNFAAKLNISFPLLRDFPLQKYGIEHLTALPVTFIISPQGKLTQTLHGPQTFQSLLLAIKD